MIVELIAIWAAAQPVPVGCDVLLTRAESRPVLRRIYRSPRPLTLPRRRVARAHVRCQRRPISRRLMARYRQRWSRWRRGHYWLLEFGRLPAWDRAWARSTSWCESRNDPTAHGGPHHGAFQFTLRTAWAAGFRVDPHLTSWHEQAVRAVRWMHVAGRGQWPVCG
jgi:hypothetical protein